MRVLVFVGEGVDVRVPPQRDPRSGRVREQWLVREIDPASARALDLALALKSAGVATEVTAIHMGPETTETYLQQALARGCDRAIRVWDEEVADSTRRAPQWFWPPRPEPRASTLLSAAPPASWMRAASWDNSWRRGSACRASPRLSRSAAR